MHVCMCVALNVCVSVCLSVCMGMGLPMCRCLPAPMMAVCVCICMHVGLCIRLCISVCMCVCVCGCPAVCMPLCVPDCRSVSLSLVLTDSEYVSFVMVYVYMVRFRSAQCDISNPPVYGILPGCRVVMYGWVDVRFYVFVFAPVPVIVLLPVLFVFGCVYIVCDITQCVSRSDSAKCVWPESVPLYARMYV